MTATQYLIEMLGRSQYQKLRKDQVIVVKGDQQTGKTTLVSVLNAAGYHAVEDFNVCEITLNTPLINMIPDFAKTICVEPETSEKY